MKQIRSPQFLQGMAMYNTLGGGSIEEDRKILPDELISLHPPADDDPVSKALANSSWLYRSSKVSFITGSAGVAKELLGQSYVRQGDLLCAGEDNSRVGDAYWSFGCDRFSYSRDLAYLGYSTEVFCSQAGRADRICDSLWYMG